MPPMRGHPGAKAKKGTNIKLIKGLISKFKWRLLIVLICLIVNSATNFTVSIFIKNITGCIENRVPTPEGLTAAWQNVIIWVVAMAIMYMVGMFAAYYWNRSMAIITQEYLNDLRKKMFNHMETLPIKYFDTHKHGDIMSMYTNDTDMIRQFISQAIPNIVVSAATLIGVLCIMFTYSVYLSLVVLLGGAFMFLNMKKMGGKAGKFFMLQQKAIGQVEGDIQEAINGLKIIKVFSHEEKSLEAFDEKNNYLYDVSNTGNKAGNIMIPITMNIGNFIYVICAILGSLFIFCNWYNVSILYGIAPMEYSIILAFLSIARMFSVNISNLTQNLVFVITGNAGASRIFDLIDEKSEADDGYVTLVHIKYNEDGTFEETNERTRYYAWKHPHKADGTTTYTELKGDIQLLNVDFSYVEGKQVLNNVSVYAHPGQKIALVGATGAGKTTITNLINRFYDIADGKIRYDGINISKIKKDDLRKSLGIVLQDVNLFTGTVMDNIRYGRLDATDEECIKAAEIANADNFIRRLPEGYNTMLSGDGANLSQGQRQLISIARAAVADAPVLVLDEATSSIDTHTEILVQKGMDQLMEGRTVFVIAHRLSTIQNSDAIMVMDHGQIIERGNHEELMEKKGIYYRLYTGAFELE